MPKIRVGKVIKEFDNVTYISPNGNDDTADGSRSKPYKSIKLALENTEDKVTNCVYFLPGTHTMKTSEHGWDSQFPTSGLSLFFTSNILNTKIIVECDTSTAFQGRYYYIGTGTDEKGFNGTISNLDITFNSIATGNQYANVLFVWLRGTISNNIIRLNTKGTPSYYYDNDKNSCIINNNAIYMNGISSPWSGNPTMTNNYLSHNPGRGDNLLGATSTVSLDDVRLLTDPYGPMYGMYPIGDPLYYLITSGSKYYVPTADYYNISAMKFSAVDYEYSNNLHKLPMDVNELVTLFKIERDKESITINPMDYFNDMNIIKIET